MARQRRGRENLGGEGGGEERDGGESREGNRNHLLDEVPGVQSFLHREKRGEQIDGTMPRRLTGRPPGRPPKSIAGQKVRFGQFCRELLHEQIGRDGHSLFQRTLGTLLAPVIEHPPNVPRCEACGRTERDYLVNGRTIAEVLFKLAAYAHGQPPAKLEVKLPGVEMTPEQARAQFAELVGLVYAKGTEPTLKQLPAGPPPDPEKPN